MENIENKEEKFDLPNAKVIRKDAVINLKVTTGMIQRLQEVFRYFSKQLTEEQIAKYKEEFPNFEEVSKGTKQFTEPWMGPVTTISFLLEAIDKAAEDQGLTYEVSVEEYIRSIMGNANPEDN